MGVALTLPVAVTEAALVDEPDAVGGDDGEMAALSLAVATEDVERCDVGDTAAEPDEECEDKLQGDAVGDALKHADADVEALDERLAVGVAEGMRDAVKTELSEALAL